MKSAFARTAALLALGWVGVFAAVSAFRPLMPVDETRYLTVAWEMWQTHHYFLPSLNFEPYSHKPPLLFWLINLAWGVTGGPSIWAARVISFSITGAFTFLSARLARKLLPQRPDIDTLTLLTLAMMPMFLIYGSVIMFDTLIGLCILCGMMAIWSLGRTQERRWSQWAMLGACIGFGVLAKGPVALVYILPPALLAPLWAPQIGPKGRWYGGLLLAVLVGAAIALCWAIPAAISGGAEYREKIFVTQSAGRMVNAFAHRRPAWFYIGVLTAYLAPFLIWPGTWIRLREGWRAHRNDAAVKFILCWIVPVFVFFSAISSKQFHYMTPIIPGFAILIAMTFDRGLPPIKSFAFPMALIAAPAIVILGFTAMDKPFLGAALPRAAELIGYIHVAIAIGLYMLAKRFPRQALHMMAASAMVLAVMLHIQLGHKFLDRYDLSPLAPALGPYRDRPMASTPKYDGEYGFAAKLTKPVDSIGREGVAEWLSQHPDGLVIGRYNDDELPQGFDILHRQDFRQNEQILLMQRLVMVGAR